MLRAHHHVDYASGASRYPPGVVEDPNEPDWYDTLPGIYREVYHGIWIGS